MAKSRCMEPCVTQLMRFKRRQRTIRSSWSQAVVETFMDREALQSRTIWILEAYLRPCPIQRCMETSTFHVFFL